MTIEEVETALLLDVSDTEDDTELLFEFSVELVALELSADEVDDAVTGELSVVSVVPADADEEAEAVLLAGAVLGAVEIVEELDAGGEMDELAADEK